MPASTRIFGRFVASYGMLFVLLLLCAYYSWVTLADQHPAGAAGGRQVVRLIKAQKLERPRVLVVLRDTEEDQEFLTGLQEELGPQATATLEIVRGGPPEARAALQRLADAGQPLQIIAGSSVTRSWAALQDLPQKFPSLGPVRVFSPASYRWPNFLKGDNLLNIANQIAVIAIIAIGMTLVIITAGIDLSVGSLIALSAVVTAWLIREAAGAEASSTLSMVWCCAVGISVCAVVGLFSGVMVTTFGIPPFIVTLGMMLVASGLAYLIAEGQSIYQVPPSFIWLGRGSSVGGIPNAVLLMLILYALAHLVMSRLTWGRYIYAVGGNAEAARLSGVPVKRVLLLVYALSGALAGLGGVVMASQLKSGAPTYGQMYELYVIAAVVVGGASLSGGEGKVLGTLIGAFIIAVIQNGMNLTGVESYTQKVVLGLVILGAVLLDTLKKRGWWRRRAKH